MIVKSCKIHNFFVFDVGEAVNLDKVLSHLEANGAQTHKPRRSSRSLLIVNNPIIFNLRPWEQTILGKSYVIHPSAKIWSFGTLSLQLTLHLEGRYKLSDLAAISERLENASPFVESAQNIVENIVNDLSLAINQPKIWNQKEDYSIFNIQELEAPPSDLRAAFSVNDVTAIILGDGDKIFSQEVNEAIAQGTYQYAANDIAIIHWNGALIYDPQDSEDICDTLEFALCQLLELRYYDSLLEIQLGTLYQKVESSKGGLFRNPYEALARTAALEYIDSTEIVDRVNNSLKIIGDFYFATIYRAAISKFRISDWRNSVDHKLNQLAEVSKIFQGEVHDRRTLAMELIIILLISIEVLSLFYRYLSEA